MVKFRAPRFMTRG